MIKLNRNSSEEELKSVYDLMVGDVFKVDNNYEGEWETIVQRIFVDYLPQGSIWCATAITPGTELYTTYGPDHFVVTSSDVKEEQDNSNS